MAHRFVVEAVHSAMQVYVGADLHRNVDAFRSFVEERDELLVFRRRRTAGGRFPQHVIEQRFQIAVVFERSV